MPIQIANPEVVAKIERLSQITGLGKTAAVEAAVTKMIEETGAPGSSADPWSRFDAILSQIRALPRRPDAFEAVEYDDIGLPK
jgi:antitoxin VapB